MRRNVEKEGAVLFVSYLSALLEFERSPKTGAKCFEESALMACFSTGFGGDSLPILVSSRLAAREAGRNFL